MDQQARPKLAIYFVVHPIFGAKTPFLVTFLLYSKFQVYIVLVGGPDGGGRVHRLGRAVQCNDKCSQESKERS